ncbi:MAG: glycosyltransferase involved in cell wall biosynthesis [Woeseiaceae bacterium]|jgi:glycosyltransferase involved in cell wall biosynthesis
MSTKVIFFVPVEKKYISKWEYYQVDYDALNQMFSEVVVCSSIWQVIKNLRGAKLIYCWWWNQSAPVVILAKLLGITTHVTGAIHMFDLSGAPDYYTKGFLYRLSSKISLALADRNLFISYDQYHQITSHIFVNNPTVVRSSLAKDSFIGREKILKQRALHRDDSTIKHRYRFLSVVWHTRDQHQRKGVFETLMALSILKQRSEFDFEWIIIGGSGDGVKKLRKRAKALNLEDHVSIHLDISQEEKREWFLKADLYIQPSWCEGFGNAVLEAMSYGLPGLVSRFTAQPEVVGNTGFISLEITPENIYQKLEEFIELTEQEKSSLVGNVINRVDKEFLFSMRAAKLKAVCIDSKVFEVSDDDIPKELGGS